MAANVCLINGVFTDHVSVQDRGFQFGDGLFETLAVEAGQPVFWAAHFRRLQAGAARLHVVDSLSVQPHFAVMNAVFDTLSFAKRLEAAGEKPEVAEAHAMALKDLVLEEVATKADIARLETKIEQLRTGFEALRSEAHARLAMMQWLLGSVGVGVLLLVIRTFWPA